MKRMVKNWGLALCCIALSVVAMAQPNHSKVKIEKAKHAYQLIVHEKPFLIIGGETGNSAATTATAMAPIWPKLQGMGLNTVLTPVYWELIEPKEGAFDFSTVDSLLLNAREHHLKLVLLWFGTWKNSMSSYVPAWVKENPKRFARTQDKEKRSQEILSALDKNILEADKKAYAALLKHLKKNDDNHNTVIMVQVENEIGMLPTAREYSKLADKHFFADVPKQLLDYLQKNKEQLKPELHTKWKANGYKTKGNWEAIFGKGIETEEIFQAWFYARFAEEVAAAGKKEYNLPMFVNAALPSERRKIPGDYPSAGPLPHLMDVWKAAAPSIDMLSPDFYTPDIKDWCDGFYREDNPLFVPEIRYDETVAAKALFVIGHYKALGFSPFHIESAEGYRQSSLENTYRLLNQISPFLNTQWTNYDGVLLSKEDPIQKMQYGQYIFTIKHDYTLGWSPAANESTWPASGAIIVHLNEHEFVVLGTGVVITVENADKNKVTNLLNVQQVAYKNGEEKILTHFNGDQTHQGRHIRISVGDWEIQKVKFYNSPAKID